MTASVHALHEQPLFRWALWHVKDKPRHVGGPHIPLCGECAKARILRGQLLDFHEELVADLDYECFDCGEFHKGDYRW